ncbi:MAG: VWA domain-containing protein [Melioribacteraceae bacterium]|nr:VWA domain-containing protein [Melioribacteraceae bacterium]
MLRFAHSEYLYILYLIPVFIFLFWLAHKQKEKLLSIFAENKMHTVLLPMRSKLKSFLKSGVVLLAFILVTIGVANPQIGSKMEEVKQVGIDVFICLDVSLSMMAEDIKPSRLEKAKHEISKLIQRLRGDRIGLIVFSGNAYVQFPLTTDYSAANLFLSAVDVSSVPQPGTNIGDAIKMALSSFKKDEETKKAVILITDGEDHEGDLEKMAKEAVDNGVQIYAIGLGSPAGVPIPVYNESGVRAGYKKDRRGEVVLTKLDETTLKDLAGNGNGKYYRGSNSSDELEEIYNDLAKIEKAEFGTTKITEYEDRFYFFLIPALLLLFVEFFISLNKSKFLQRFIKLEE